MKSFDELYHELLIRQNAEGETPLKEYDPFHLDCLLHPEKYPPVIHINECEKCAYDQACQNSCIFDAIERTEDGRLKINRSLCVGCEACIEACKKGNLAASKDAIPAMKAVREGKGPVYMLVAPAFMGQFSDRVTPGKLRTAFKALGFTGMVEVALFADILTLKEALEFDQHVQQRGDYQLTSCCCPVWIAMIRKIFLELMPHVPAAVSPMIACGRMIKRLHPDAVTVFAGPCLAKKKEAKEPDIMDAVDYVLTFQEVQDIFDAADIHPDELADAEKEHASRAGRLYARTGGVSQAVTEMVNQLHPNRSIRVRSEQAEGTKACMEMIRRIKEGRTEANFFEGMGCVGGCVGGPKAVLNVEEGTKHVDAYGGNAKFRTPLENPYVRRVLEELGIRTVEELLTVDGLLTRDFS
jgi:Iron only hydrogenase large subunit, C-terminal domain